MARDDPQSRIRFPPALKERLEETARRSNRSFNAEVVARLEGSFLEDRLLKFNEAPKAVEYLKEIVSAIEKATFQQTEVVVTLKPPEREAAEAEKPAP